MARKKNDTIKVDQNTVPVSLTVSNPNEFPLVYSDDTWDVIASGSSLAGIMGNFGQYDQHSINEALADNVGDSELGTAVTASQTVGGIASGTTLSANTTFYEFVNRLINPYIPPTASLSISPEGVREKGDEVTSVTMTVTVTKGTSNISYIEFFRQGIANPVYTETSGVASGGTFSYTYVPENAITTDTSFRGSVAVDLTSYDSNIKGITFAYFVYYGTSASTSVPTASELTSKASSSSENPTFLTDAYVWYLSPNTKTTIQQNIMGQWVDIDTETGQEVTFTTGTGEVATYYAYRSTKKYAAGADMSLRIV